MWAASIVKVQVAADRTKLASEALDKAKATAPPMPPAQAHPQQPAQQQQRPQPEKDDE